MIQYTKTQVTYFNTVEEFYAHIDALKSSGDMSADVNTGLRINELAQERVSVANMPSTIVHARVQEARLNIGPS